MRFQNLGIFILLLVIVVITTSIQPSFADPANLRSLVRDTGLYGLISIGVAMVIITGGIDLSIGSLIALSGVLLVQVVNVRIVDTNFESKIIETRAEVVEPFTGPALRLSEPLPAISKGDLLSYASTTGTSSVVIERTVEVGDQTFIELRDRLQLLRPGVPVRLQRLQSMNPYLACGIVLLVASSLGLIHGLLITWGNLQPFVVTLCGLLIYRGLARVLTGDNQVGLLGALPEFKARFTGAVFELPVPLVARLGSPEARWLDLSWIEIPFSGVILAVVAVAGWVFLNRSVWGRHLLATGENEKAARYSGVRTQTLIVFAYVICAFLAGLTGILFTLELNSVQPGSSGSFYELYAIAAAVLGGCSLRGGRGAILSVIAGAAVMRCLYKSIVVLGISQEWEMVIIGVALLAAVSLDEILLRWTARKRRHSIG
ncbi:MAG: ABC transporter permease [Planctomycetaceae bacterium]